MPTLLLASASPRRSEILARHGFHFDVSKPEIDEIWPNNLNYKEIPAYLSLKKLEKAISEDTIDHDFILTADTLVFYKNKPLGKPLNRKEAETMIVSLQGNKHKVITGLSLYSRQTGQKLTRSTSTQVNFASMDTKEIEAYLHTNEWKGVAGGYRIQGKAALYITRIKGSYTNVVGLPIHIIYGMLREFNFQFDSFGC